MPYEAKTNWKYDDTVTEKDLNRIEQGLKDAHVAEYKDITLKPGVQIVDVPEDTPFRMGEIRGRTLINLLGYAGACDNTSLWKNWCGTSSLNSEYKVEGATSICVKIDDSFNYGNAFRFVDRLYSKKSYVLVGYVMNGNAVGIRLAAMEYNGSTSLKKYDTSDVKDTLNFNPVHVAFTLSEGANEFAVHLEVRGSEKNYGYFDAIRVYEISDTEVVKINSMTSEQVAKEYPYVDAMTNVKNPYAFSTSRNLVPPFTEWNGGFNGVATEPYTQWVTTAGDRINSATKIKALEGLTYTLYIERIGDGEIGLDFRDAQNDVIQTSGFVKQNSITATAPQGTVSVKVWTSAPTATPKGYAFRNPMLTIGSVPEPFEPQVRNMWATESQLAAHPVDGSNADVLYVGDDGLPYILEKWEKVVLDGSVNWEYDIPYKGYKRVRTVSPFLNAIPYSQLVTNYNGVILPNIDEGINWPSGDISQMYTNKLLFLTISNLDSGWGDDYKPSPEEIKAYFLGWRICQEETAGLYNGTGTRCWGRITDPANVIGVAGWNATREMPTKHAGRDAKGNLYTPFRLQYLKAKPTVESVRNYETGLTLSKGWNIVEVDSGIVIREKANPVYVDHYTNGPSYYINGDTITPSKLMHRPKEIISIVKNQGQDMWNIIGVAPEKIQIFGRNQAFIPAYNFDTLAVYHVTYKMLNPTLSAPINGSITTNLRGTVTDVVRWASDAERRLSVMENQKEEKDVPQWISPTLINGWVNRNIGDDAPAGYLKDHQGFVHFRGIVLNGTAGANNIFYLPEGCRPSRRLQFINLSANASAGLITSYITIEVSGAVYFNAGAVTHWLSLDNISFQAEQ